MPRYAYGGQALIEGVMMRGRDAIAVALRHPDGRILWAAERLDTGFHKNPVSRWPFVRGTATGPSIRWPVCRLARYS